MKTKKELAELENLGVNSIHVVDNPANDEEFIQVKGDIMDEARIKALELIAAGLEAIASLGEAANSPENQILKTRLDEVKRLRGAEGFEDSVARQEVDVAEAAIAESIEGVENGADQIEAGVVGGTVEKFQGKILKETLRALVSVLKSLDLDLVIKEAKNSSMTEAVSFEEAGDDDSVWKVCIIKEGVSSNRFLHKKENFAALARLCEGVKIYANHIPDGRQHELPERPVQEIVGWLENCRVEHHPGPAKVVGDARFVESAAGKDVKNILRSSFKQGKKDLIGLSVEATGKKRMGTHEGRTVQIVENYRGVFSVDVVNAPSAGGSFTDAIRESISRKDAEQMKTIDEMTAKELKELRPDLFPDAITEGEKKTDTTGISPVERIAENETPETDPKLIKLYQRSVDGLVDATNLPDVAKDRIREAVRNDSAADIEVAETRIAEEVKYFGSILDAQKREDSVNNSSITESVSNPTDQIFDDLLDFFGPRPKRLHSFKQLHIALTGDTDVSGKISRNRGMGNRMAEAQKCLAGRQESLLRNPATRMYVPQDHITEIDRATWPDLYTNIIHQAMVMWSQEPALKKWKDAVDMVVSSKARLEDFENNNALVLGGFATLPAVAESGVYAAIAGGTLDGSDYAATKRGGTVFITREMIKGDKIGAVQGIPKMLAISAWYTLFNFVWQTLIRANPAMDYDAVDLFDAAGHANEPAVPIALTAAGLLQAINRMAAQTLPGAAATFPISLKPKILWAGPAQREAVFELINSEQKVNATEDSTIPNFFNQYGIDQSMILDFMPLTGANSEDWGIIADPTMNPTIELGFVDGKEDPEIITQDSPTEGEVFTNDRITFKIRHEYGGVTLRHETFDGNIVP